MEDPNTANAPEDAIIKSLIEFIRNQSWGKFSKPAIATFTGEVNGVRVNEGELYDLDAIVTNSKFSFRRLLLNPHTLIKSTNKDRIIEYNFVHNIALETILTHCRQKTLTIDDLECPIWYLVYENPVILLDCGHTFSREILQNSWNASSQNCPICRRKYFKNLDEVTIKNEAVAKIVEMYEYQIADDEQKRQLTKERLVKKLQKLKKSYNAWRFTEKCFKNFARYGAFVFMVIVIFSGDTVDVAIDRKSYIDYSGIKFIIAGIIGVIVVILGVVFFMAGSIAAIVGALVGCVLGGLLGICIDGIRYIIHQATLFRYKRAVAKFVREMTPENQV